MKKTFSLIAAVLLCTAALHGAVSEDRDLGNFSAVVVSGPVEITYSQDEVCGIFVESAVDERMKNLITEVDKTGCLTIRPKPINKRLVEDIRGIKITLSSPYLFKNTILVGYQVQVMNNLFFYFNQVMIRIVQLKLYITHHSPHLYIHSHTEKGRLL